MVDLPQASRASTRLSRPAIAVCLLAAATLLPGLGLRDPWPPDEPRFVLAAEEMLESGRWWITTRAGEVYSDKPPVFMWMEALVLWLTGSRRLAFQLPSLLAALGTLGLTFDLGRRLWNERIGWWAAGILAVTVQFVWQARSGQIDATVTFFTTLGLYGLLRHALLGPSWPWFLGGFASMGAGVLTKGVGFLPVLALIPLAWGHRAGWRRLGPKLDRRWLLGPAVLLLVVSLWAVPLLVGTALTGDPELTAYRNDLLLQQTVQRYVEPSGHLKPPWYFLTSVIPWAWLPVSLAFPWLLPAWWRRLRRRDGRYLVLLGWILAVVLFFSLSEGKRGVYLLPAVPALALATAPLASGLRRIRGLNLLAAALAGLIALVIGWGALQPDRLRDRGLAELHPPLIMFFLVVLAAMFFARPRRGLAALCAVFVSGWVVLGLWVYPGIDGQRSGRNLMEAVEERLKPGEELAVVDWREQMSLQMEEPIHQFGFQLSAREQARMGAGWLADGGPSRRLLVPEREMDPCFESSEGPVAWSHRQHWYLVSKEELTGTCQAGASEPASGGAP